MLDRPGTRAGVRPPRPSWRPFGVYSGCFTNPDGDLFEVVWDPLLGRGPIARPHPRQTAAIDHPSGVGHFTWLSEARRGPGPLPTLKRDQAPEERRTDAAPSPHPQRMRGLRCLPPETRVQAACRILKEVLVKRANIAAVIVLAMLSTAGCATSGNLGD